MHLTKSTEQAICIMIMLYMQDRKIYLNSKEISDRLEISPTYLKKIMRKLVVSKLVLANTGVGGGYKYRQSKIISLYDIYKAINGEVSLFVLQSEYIEKIFKGVLNVSSRYEDYLKKIEIINQDLKNSLEKITIDEIVIDILKQSAHIRLDWNNWESELKDIYKKINK
ncbi:RrF2 family transcriptional regulator [Gemelliphila asaccharolytica]|uniref:Transcriptional regulator, Rrf2 family n=1 Tax=Gemelliphila asaccharolytica TaxID=502393 RepID=A0ABR5TNL7_9BACL|nr:Rrf2 family transcriptional regulator [Gemella asaccharolytica]KXB59022.1 transcriptional regulator, Rrf2 family [Gemella asaccharolytica]